jgi:hypothetical protein
VLRDRVFRRRFVAAVDAGWLCSCAERCLIVVLLAALGCLTTFAYGSPPDPVWRPGIYDNADYDEVVALLIDTAGLGDSPLLVGEPVPFLLELVSFRRASVPLDASLLGFHLRSPPSVRAPGCEGSRTSSLIY